LAFPEELVGQLVNNRAKVLRRAWILQMFAGILLLSLGYFLGHAHFHLLREGVRAPGRIIGYQQERFRSSSSSSSTAYMPIVEFHASDRFIQFKDWMGSGSTGALYTPVNVLYDPANPTDAMIDRPIWNWMPWAPTFAVGLLLFLGSIRRFSLSRRSAEVS
jgi:hypothetical protein